MRSIKPNNNRNPQIRYLRFLPSTFPSSIGRCSMMFSSISIENLPFVLRSVFRMLSRSVFLNQEWNRLSTNMASISVSMLYYIPSKVLQVSLLQLVLFNLYRHSVHNAITLYEQLDGFFNLIELFIAETMRKEHKACISEDTLQLLPAALRFCLRQLDTVNM